VFRRLSNFSTKQITLFLYLFAALYLCHVNYEDELCVSEIMLILKGSGNNMCDSELAVSALCSASQQK